MHPLTRITRGLCRDVEQLSFAAPVTHTYNPLKYARTPHEMYIDAYGQTPKEAVLVGMNPGPFGMAQTGVPFGDVGMVRDWMGIEARVGRPPQEHPKRQIQGFECTRSEVSGSRLWGWAKSRFGDADRFFARFFVLNYCPLVFLEETGRNRTPNKLPKSEREPLLAACDNALRAAVEYLRPARVIGVGKWATDRSNKALAGLSIPVGTVLHPSPASPKANRGWAPQAEADFRSLGVQL